jgi:hypothetical protein
MSQPIDAPDDELPGARHGRKRLPLICGFCKKAQVVALRSAERVLIRCEACGRRIFAFYTDPTRQQAGAPPPSEDPLFVKQVEQELMRSVSQQAGALYEYLRRYAARHGYAPTLREIQLQFSWRSLNTVSHHLRQLESVGLIERDYGEARGIRLPHAA